MTHLLPAARRVVPVLTAVAMLSASVTSAYAANGAITGLRPVTVPNYSSSSGGGTANPAPSTSGWPQLPYPASTSSGGATSANPWPANAGCDQTQVAPAMQNAANYTYAQTYANDMATVQQPQSYSSCLASLLQDAQLIDDMFVSGFSISAAITAFAQVAVQNILTSLENKVCKIVQTAAQGIFGGFHKDFNLLGNSSVISINASISGGTSAIPTTGDPVDFPMPVQTPAAPIVVPAAPTSPPTKPPSSIPTPPSKN